jgi:hypothetical protein
MQPSHSKVKWVSMFFVIFTFCGFFAHRRDGLFLFHRQAAHGKALQEAQAAIVSGAEQARMQAETTQAAHDKALQELQAAHERTLQELQVFPTASNSSANLEIASTIATSYLATKTAATPSSSPTSPFSSPTTVAPSATPSSSPTTTSTAMSTSATAPDSDATAPAALSATATAPGSLEKRMNATNKKETSGWFENSSLALALATVTTHHDRCCFAPDSSPELPLTFFQDCAKTQKAKGWDTLTERFYHRETRRTDLSRCAKAWSSMFMQQAGCFYIQGYVRARARNKSTSFDYVTNLPNLPRVLLLGDSLSRGTWVAVQEMFASSDAVSIHGAPTNCGGFQRYNESLDAWLGTCPWGLIHFNIGMHYNGDPNTYAVELGRIVTRMRQHSPDAHIVFATTTPSPLDSPDTVPKSTCHNHFHKAGFVSELNLASRVLKLRNVTINDRYTMIHPHLGEYQNPCDVHFSQAGYRSIAVHDWQIFTKLLGLE